MESLTFNMLEKHAQFIFIDQPDQVFRVVSKDAIFGVIKPDVLHLMSVKDLSKIKNGFFVSRKSERWLKQVRLIRYIKIA